jgi:hypothetical protein
MPRAGHNNTCMRTGPDEVSAGTYVLLTVTIQEESWFRAFTRGTRWAHGYECNIQFF